MVNSLETIAMSLVWSTVYFRNYSHEFSMVNSLFRNYSQEFSMVNSLF